MSRKNYRIGQKSATLILSGVITVNFMELDILLFTGGNGELVNQ